MVDCPCLSHTGAVCGKTVNVLLVQEVTVAQIISMAFGVQWKSQGCHPVEILSVLNGRSERKQADLYRLTWRKAMENMVEIYMIFVVVLEFLALLALSNSLSHSKSL